VLSTEAAPALATNQEEGTRAMLIQLLIEREGDTHITKLENIRYTFKRNEQRDMVCEIANKEHLVWMLGTTSYRQYQLATGEPPELKTPLGELAGKPAKGKRKAA